MADNTDNILVEFDYDNITLIDPNRTIDPDGTVKERLVKQEDLVFYANLECNVLPRTKLAVGNALNDSQRTISVGKINFLNPGNKKFMDTAWSDEITGKGSLRGEGVNQVKLTSAEVLEPKRSSDYYITQNLLSNGKPGATDTGLLGMKDITVNIDSSFLPVIDITLEDVKGRALFEGGNNSPYAAFFQLPYPQFQLTLKGYYGKAIKLPIMLQSFTSSFDPSSHNFVIKLKFYGYKYTLLSYVNFGMLMAVPFMYPNTITRPATTQTTQSTQKETAQNETIVYRGYEKMREIYSDYKSKGLIDDDFPEITLNQLRYRLDDFIKDILDKYSKENLGVITEISNYLTTLNSYRLDVYSSSSSWYYKYLDRKVPFVSTDGLVYYTFKKGIDQSQKISAVSELSVKYIQNFNERLSENSVLGTNGNYSVGGKVFKTDVNPTKITINTIAYSGLTFDPLKTYKERYPNIQRVDVTGDTNYISFKTELNGSVNSADLFFIFENPGGFVSITDNMSKQATSIRKTIEQQITDNLAEQFTSKSTGLGFVPSIRNILAVFYCQGEAFLRLMDDVHKKSWDQRNNKYRRAAIFGNQSTATSVDIKTSTQNDEPIYPWPQVLKETTSDDNKEKFELIYPGDLSVASTYNAYNPDIWPEVEFVEEFIKGYVIRQIDTSKGDTIQVNLLEKPKRISLNSIDFPVSDQIFQNKEQAKYFYEIYERVLLNSYYSKLGRQNSYQLSIYNVEAENEAINILESLGTDNPYLSKILKEYLIDQSNFIPFLRHISNQGQGESWQKYIRGEFTTPYIRSEVNNPNRLFNIDILSQGKSQPDVSVKNESNVRNIKTYVGDSSVSNLFDFTDLYPITNLEWDQANLADGQSLQSPQEAYNTRDVLRYNETQKTITNFSSDIFNNNNAVRPFTNFNFNDLNITPNNVDLKTFYETRKIEDQFITEGNLNYSGYSGNVVPNQTTSILNSPYFMNAIQEGVKAFRYNQSETSPYKVAAYLFLNSLPLATLREKYKTKDAAEDLDYLISTFKKFGAIHRLPYSWVLKYGSIWNRYKTWLNTGTDMLDSSWTNFNYLQNYDPVNSASTKTFNLTINNTQQTIVLNQSTGIGPYTDINVGFYPQLMEDFNVFLQGRNLFSGQTQIGGTGQIVSVTGDCSQTFVVTGTCNINNSFVTFLSMTNYNALQNGVTVSFPSLGITGTIVAPSGPGTYFVSNIPTGTIGNFLDCDFGNFTSVSNVNNQYLYNGSSLIGNDFLTSPFVLGKQITGTAGGNGVYQVDSGTTSGTTSFTTGGGYLIVNNIDSNVLTNGSQISGTLMTGVTINSQLSGTSGGQGVYSVSPLQQPTTSNFTVAGQFAQGITSSSVQNLIDTKKLVLFTTNGSKIIGVPGFDQSNFSRTLNLATWSVLTRSNDLTSYYVLPSFGANINQAKSECFTGVIFPYMKTDIINNPAMYNGSVRLYWNAPNYGWFDNSEVVKNSPDTYLKTILNNKKIQQNFSINGSVNDYTDISEIFTTFDKGILDLFENEFLNFSKAVYDFEDSLPSSYVTPTSTETVANDLTYKNFQGLMRELLKVETPVGNSGEEILNDVVVKQNLKFQTILNGFINYNCVFKYGNPSFFNRKIFNSYSFQFVEDRYIANPYVQGTVPTNGGSITLAQSKSTNPTAWKALENYIGFSTIPELKYSDNGSYITDFFPTMNIAFEENDILSLAPLIKIFATQKLNNPNLTRNDFFNLNDSYLQSCLTYANNVISVLMPSVRAELPTVFIDQESKVVRAPLEAEFTEQTRTELWETFKALNDAWIAGFDLSNRTLFEDVMLIDRASRDVGDKVYVDIFKIKDLIESYSYRNSLLDTVETIVKTNNFQSFMLPSYVNFYNVQDAEKNPIPRPDGSLEFANSLFGTFLNVDYRNSSPKYLCMYVSKPSEHLNMSDNVDYRFRDDAFDMRRSSDNPLIESQQGKTDWARSNKVVGFNVDITQQNQQIFKQLDLNQDPGKPTSESLEALNQMANQGRNRGTTTQNVSLYNLYKNRSYECSIDMMGNALMQPTMYFNLRNIPMFSGPYLVTKVSHRITEDGFDTTITGTRQSFNSLPKVDGFIQSLNINILNTIQQKVVERETSLRGFSGNVISQKTQILQNVSGTDSLTNGQTCVDLINPNYRNYTPVETPVRTTQSLKTLYSSLKEKYVAKGYTGGTDSSLLYYTLIAYTFIYVDSVNNSGGISAFQNNYSTFDLKERYSQQDFLVRTERKFFCINRGDNDTNIPIASFRSFNDFLEFVTTVIASIKLSVVSDLTLDPNLVISLTKNYVLKYPIQRDENVWVGLDPVQRTELENKFRIAIDSYLEQNDIEIPSNVQLLY